MSPTNRKALGKVARRMNRGRKPPTQAKRNDANRKRKRASRGGKPQRRKKR